MRIGILTWFFAANYGAKLHSYALQQIIESMGHECEFIRFIPKISHKINIYSNLNFPYRKKHPILILNGLRRMNRIQKFQNNYSVSKPVHSVEEIDALGYDLIIIGSDEVINLSHPLFNEVYYGVGILKTPVATYAPSSGQTDTSSRLPDEYRTSLEKMIAISARDVHSQKLLENNHKGKVNLVLDPTLLFDFSEVSVPIPEKKYILIYSFDDLDVYSDDLLQFAEEQKLRLVAIGRYVKWAHVSMDVISVPQWLGAFRGAEYVVTDSFHGTVFALKNGVPFIIVKRSDKINKIADFVASMGIDINFYSKSYGISKYLNKKFNYDQINDRLGIMVQESINYLNLVLSNVSNNKEG